MSCPRCQQGRFLPGEPKGSIQTDFAGAYLATPSTNTHPKRAVLLLSDVYGLGIPNPKIIADEIAEKLECEVWVPDYFKGRPLFHPSGMEIPSKPDERLSAWEWVRWFCSNIVPNLGAHWASRPSVADRRVAELVSLIRERRNYEKIGAFGHCYGGSACIRLGGTDLFNSVVICHPGPFSMKQVKAVKVPIAWVCAEYDEFFSETTKQQCKAELAGREGTPRFVDYEFVEYKGTTHGFACRPDHDYPDVVDAYNKAQDQIAGWFENTLVLDSKE